MEITDTPELNSDMMDRIRNERIKQIEKWGKQTHTLDQYLTILTEEVGEVAKEICNVNWPSAEEVPFLIEDLDRGSNYIPKSVKVHASLEELQEELCQVAAVAMAMMTGIQKHLDQEEEDE